MLENIVELLKTEAAREYVIKASICWLVSEIKELEYKTVLRKYGYKKKKCSFRSYIKVAIAYAILAVPYVGVFITIVNIISISQDITLQDLMYRYNCEKDILGGE